jgi:hypothetical protein
VLIVDEIGVPLDAFKSVHGAPQLRAGGWELAPGDPGDSVRLELARELAGERTLEVTFDLEMRIGAIASCQVLELGSDRVDTIANHSATSTGLFVATVRRSLRGDTRLVLKVACGGEEHARLVGVYVRRVVKGRG